MEEEREEQAELQRMTPKAHPKPTVVGIGASAGGLAALKQFFEFIPTNSGLAFVVVVHLSPEHKSHLCDLLQPSVKVPVHQVVETMPLEMNNVYVIPPNANLSAVDTHLRLSKLEEQRRERAPIDHFFRTLASTHDGHSIGVVLTGTGSDGTLGLKEIKAKGGVVLVQDPNEAEFDGMPQSAIATGLIDRVLPIAEIAQALVRLADLGPRIPLADKQHEPTPSERMLLPKVLALVKARTERDFSRYKPATVLRRIARRMQLNYVTEFDRYLERLRQQPEEVQLLADDLLINVTSFFRDPEVFQKLETDIVPRLFEGKGSNDTLRVWSVGCATGEEAYSVAMLLLQEAAQRPQPPRIQIFASDLHKRSLNSAREGLYPGDIETDVSAERLQRFFRKENGGYRISKEVRDLVVFAPHNLLNDPPFSRVDLITCRNLLIYLDRSLQSDVIDLFHYALCPNGYLLLGSAETMETAELFKTEDKRLCLYQKRNVPAPEPRLPVFPLTRLRPSGEERAQNEARSGTTAYPSIHQTLLERFAPPSILVDPDNKVVHLSEHAGRYLLYPGGEITSNVLQIVRDELRRELQALLTAAREKKNIVDSNPIPVQFNGHSAPVVMHVRPATDPNQTGFVLVIFDEHQPLSETAENGAAPSATEPTTRNVGPLQSELDAERQRLQMIIEEYETSQEEMKAANEEMQSTNEELRSTMEELETSKEELQSINEELQTVNQENRHKVEELSQLSSDLQNLLSATDIATLFLDRDLRIMRFTPKLADLFNVRVIDRGRPISDLTQRLGYGQLCQDAQAVLSRLIPVERETQDDAGRWYLTRVLPYRSTEDRIEGVVLTFTDITLRKSAEKTLSDSEARQSFLLHLSDALRPLAEPSAIQAAGSHLLGEHLNADRVYYIEILEARGTCRVGSNYLRGGSPSLEGEYPLADYGATLRSLRRGETLVVTAGEGLQAIPAGDKAGEAANSIQAFIAVPFERHGELVAAFCVTESAPRTWLPAEAALVREAGERIWAAAERARAEVALRQSEMKYRTLFDSIDEGYCLIQIILDEQGKPVDLLQLEVNHAYGRQTGLSNAVGKRLLEMVPHADQKWIDFYGTVALTGQAARTEYYVEAIERWFTSYASRVGGEGSMVVAVVFDDISERKRHEQRQALLLQLSDAVRPLADSAEIQFSTTQITRKFFGADRCYYCEIEGGNAVIRRDASRDDLPSVAGVYPLSSFPIFKAVVDAKHPFVVRDAHTTDLLDEALRQLCLQLQIISFVDVPVLKEGKPTGILCITQTTPRNWTKFDMELAEEIAERIWAAIERVRAEAARRVSEDRQRVLLEGIPQLVWRSTDTGDWTWASPQWMLFTGQSQQESIGSGWLNALHPDDRDRARQAWEKAISQGLLDVEHRIRRASDQAYLWFRTRSLPVRNEQGQTVEWVGTSTDIEDQKQAEMALREAEERFSLFVENVQEYALVQTDTQGTITSWNPGAQRLFGYGEEQMLGRNFGSLLTPEDQDRGVFLQELAQVRQGKRHEEARWFVRLDGSRFWSRWISEPIFDESGQFRGLAKIMRDETERQHASDTMQHSLEEKEELLKEVHHRVKNNLQVIVSLLHMQASQIQEERILSLFQETRNRVLAISSIHELLYRAESFANISLSDYARQLVPGLVQFYGLEQRVQAELLGDGATLELERAVPYGMLLNELVSNACKHAFPTPQAGTLTVQIQPDGDDIELIVADTGPGLPEGFDYRKATSLGLKLVHGLVRQLGGTIKIQSGPGTTITVRFPATDAGKDE